jgi:hypothetical protein
MIKTGDKIMDNLQAKQRPSVTTRKQREMTNWYLLKIVHNGGVLLGLTIFFLSRVENPTALQFLTFPLMLVAGSFVVWAFHRYPLHRRYKIFPYAYNKHTVEHHNLYTYHDLEISSFKEVPYIMFGVFDVLGFALVFCPVFYYGLSLILPANVVNMVLASSAAYFIIYEFFHSVSHVPKDHFLLKVPYLKFMWKHHRIHHHQRLMHTTNFNIVLPIFDWLMGTMKTELPADWKTNKKEEYVADGIQDKSA